MPFLNFSLGRVHAHHRLVDTGLTFDLTPPPKNRHSMAQHLFRKIDELRRAMDVVVETYRHDLAGITSEMIAIRSEIARTLVSPGDPKPEAALAAAIRYAAVEESAEAYRDYRTAVFEPGLSPEQRRLLFGAAIEALRLPLPSGDLQPTNRGR